MSKNKVLITGFFSLWLIFTGLRSGKAQPAKTIAFSTLEGAVTGVVLGAGTMALKNSGNVDPLRIGTGAGTLFGAGSGIYDVVRMDRGQRTVYGLFSTGSTSMEIILRDTFYGGVAGTALGAAIVMISGEKFTEGLRNGVGAGVWTGFGFGLIDAYFVGKNNQVAVKLDSKDKKRGIRAAGLISYNPTSTLSLGAVSPQVYPKTIRNNRVATGIGIGIGTETGLGVGLLNIRLGL